MNSQSVAYKHDDNTDEESNGYVVFKQYIH